MSRGADGLSILGREGGEAAGGGRGVLGVEEVGRDDSRSVVFNVSEGVVVTLSEKLHEGRQVGR